MTVAIKVPTTIKPITDAASVKRLILSPRVVINLGVSYDTDINKLEKVLNKLNNKVKKIDNVVGDLELLGVDSFNASDISYMITVLCKPNTHYGVKRSMLKLIKEEFDKEGINIPYTQIDLHLVEDKTK